MALNENLLTISIRFAPSVVAFGLTRLLVLLQYDNYMP